MRLTHKDTRALRDVEDQVWEAHEALRKAERLLAVLPYSDSMEAWRRWAADLRDQDHNLGLAVHQRLSAFDTQELREESA